MDHATAFHNTMMTQADASLKTAKDHAASIEDELDVRTKELKQAVDLVQTADKAFDQMQQRLDESERLRHDADARYQEHVKDLTEKANRVPSSYADQGGLPVDDHYRILEGYNQAC